MPGISAQFSLMSIMPGGHFRPGWNARGGKILGGHFSLHRYSFDGNLIPQQAPNWRDANWWHFYCGKVFQFLSLDSLTSLSNCKTNSRPRNQLLREMHARSERVVYNFKMVTRVIRNHSDTKEYPRSKKKKKTVKQYGKIKLECSEFSQPMSYF